MGCFFGCFRTKDPQYHLVSTPKEGMVSRNKNALSSVFLSDEKDSDIEKGASQNPLEVVEFRELRHEAKFLKACGTIPETPVEIRKVPRKCVGISTQKEESSKFDSWILHSSIDEKLEKQSDESSTPVKTSEEWATRAESPVGTPRTRSCMAAGHSTRRDSVSSTLNNDIQSAITPKNAPDNHIEWSAISSAAFATTVKRTNKSVRFECLSDRSTSSSENSTSSGSKQSPYPTPLKLSDEMQTPGTVYPAYMNNIAGGKTTKIRSQYVYPVLNPIEDRPQLERQKSDEAILISTPISAMSKDDASVRNYRKEELSLNHWLKQDSDNEEGKIKELSPTCAEKVQYGITPGPGYRPILGIVAAHWNDEEGTHSSPKWDGNGIPNTTTKYKEDQKVSWHATPFEERLEKALCEDTLISQRRRLSGTPPVEFDEIEESDAASSSQVQSSTHLKSIISF